MDFNALEDFQLVASHGGLGKASRASGRSKATLSRRVADLEEALGIRLIEREGASLLLEAFITYSDVETFPLSPEFIFMALLDEARPPSPLRES